MEDSSPFRVRQRSNWTVRTRLDRQRRAVNSDKENMTPQLQENLATVDATEAVSIRQAGWIVPMIVAGWRRRKYCPVFWDGECSGESESTTQLVTSGDDRTVKFWDVRDAHGKRELPGGWDTFCPFASTKRPPCQSEIRSS
jgi:hypothetical protein